MSDISWELIVQCVSICEIPGSHLASQKYRIFASQGQ
jgi:hypothetical protein